MCNPDTFRNLFTFVLSPFCLPIYVFKTVQWKKNNKQNDVTTMQTFVKFGSKIDLKKVQNAKPRLELEFFFFFF